MRISEAFEFAARGPSAAQSKAAPSSAGPFFVGCLLVCLGGCVPSIEDGCERDDDCPGGSVCRLSICLESTDIGAADAGPSDVGSDASSPDDAAIHGDLGPGDAAPGHDSRPADDAAVRDARPPADAGSDADPDAERDAEVRVDAGPDAAPDACVPSEETCNGRDDDCDFAVDETFDTLGAPCEVGDGPCRRGGVYVCADEHTVVCNAVPGEGLTEICNGSDDDCDGEIDEDADLVCYGGPPHTRGLGICRDGVAPCLEGGIRGPCGDDIRPLPAEVCDADGHDEDCDGVVDEGCTCDEGITEACGSNVGECSVGFRVCRNGEWRDCIASRLPGQFAEVCNGLDDDCDGESDEGFPLGQGCELGLGQCRAEGVTVCRNGDAICDAQIGEPGIEQCGTGLDEDCDGEIDEGFLVDVPCELVNEGCLSVGTRVCSEDRTSTVCDAVPIEPTVELCGTLADEDCDGEVDEGFEAVGEVCSAGVGECLEFGVMVCAAGGADVVCDAQIGVPGDEECRAPNGLDDDCDGIVDEGAHPGEACTDGFGPCQVDGTVACVDGGTWICAPSEPLPATCENARAEGQCVRGVCVWEACTEGWFDDDADLSNGCERGCGPSVEGQMRFGLTEDWPETIAVDARSGAEILAWMAPNEGGDDVRVAGESLFGPGVAFELTLSIPGVDLSWPDVALVDGGAIVVARARARSRDSDLVIDDGIAVFGIASASIDDLVVVRQRIASPGRPAVASRPSGRTLMLISGDLDGGDGGDEVPAAWLSAEIGLADGVLAVSPPTVVLRESLRDVRPAIAATSTGYAAAAVRADGQLVFVSLRGELNAVRVAATEVLGPGPVETNEIRVHVDGTRALVAFEVENDAAIFVIPISVAEPRAPVVGADLRLTGERRVLAHPEIVGAGDDFTVWYTDYSDDGPVKVKAVFLRWSTQPPNDEPTLARIGTVRAPLVTANNRIDERLRAWSTANGLRVAWFSRRQGEQPGIFRADVDCR